MSKQLDSGCISISPVSSQSNLVTHLPSLFFVIFLRCLSCEPHLRWDCLTNRAARRGPSLVPAETPGPVKPFLAPADQNPSRFAELRRYHVATWCFHAAEPQQDIDCWYKHAGRWAQPPTKHNMNPKEESKLVHPRNDDVQSTCLALDLHQALAEFLTVSTEQKHALGA